MNGSINEEERRPGIRVGKPVWLGFLGMGLVGVLPWVGRGGEYADWIRFLGHFHPVVLHFPIGVYGMLILHEVGMLTPLKRWFGGVPSQGMYGIGAVSAVVAVVAGYMLYLGHPNDYLGQVLAERHLWAGVIFAELAIGVYVLKVLVAKCERYGWVQRWLLVVAVGVMIFASHDGASMTHGRDYLTRYAPKDVSEWLGLASASREQHALDEIGELAVYRQVIAPIFDRRCVACHQADQAKGRLRMDTYEMLLKGGVGGPTIVPGKADESLAIQRIELPEEDEEHMPKAGSPDIEPAELRVVKWWLNAGADPHKQVKDYEVSQELRRDLKQVVEKKR